MKHIHREPERIEGELVFFDVSTRAHPDTWAVVDIDDWPSLRGRRWSATKRLNGLYIRNGGAGLLHRFLLSPPPQMVVDHRDGNPLNNSRSNLRVCSQADNNTWGADRRRGYELEWKETVVTTSDHVVKMKLADGSVREYRYPTRAKRRTKRHQVRKISQNQQNGSTSDKKQDVITG